MSEFAGLWRHQNNPQNNVKVTRVFKMLKLDTAEEVETEEEEKLLCEM